MRQIPTNMAFRSKAQIAKFGQLRKEGKIGLDTIARMSMHTPDNLPDRVNQHDEKQIPKDLRK